MINAAWLNFVYEGGAVLRFHARPGIKPQTDAEHSWGVAMLCYALTGGDPSANLLMAALTHDLAEQATGDVPAPTKRALELSNALEEYEQQFLIKYGLTYALTPDEQKTLKLADALDGVMYCAREAKLGNRAVTVFYAKWKRWIAEEPLTLEQEKVVIAVFAVYAAARNGYNFDVFEEEAAL